MRGAYQRGCDEKLPVRTVAKLEVSAEVSTKRNCFIWQPSQGAGGFIGRTLICENKPHE